MAVLELHQRFEGDPGRRVYRNLRMAAMLGVFAVIVLGLILSQSLGSSTRPAARGFGLVLVTVLALYVGRAMSVEVRISPETVKIRNILTTHTIPWREVAAVDAVSSRASSISPASNVVFRLTDGRVVRAQALRRTSSDANAIANDLASRFLSPMEPTLAQRQFV